MPVCKKCFKSFKTLTPSHVMKKHGYGSLAEYIEDTRDIEIPADILREDMILREKLRKERSNKMIGKNTKTGTVDSENTQQLSGDVSNGQIDSGSSAPKKASLNAILQAGFKKSRNK